jgi:hypothetical protein
MTDKIFYSWQSDRRKSRNFVEAALKKAIKELGCADDELHVPDRSLKLDKDTQGVPGSPKVAETILQKIENCCVFVPDLTFVGAGDVEDEDHQLRPLPNPNVLIEYGWAKAKVGDHAIVPVINTAFGGLGPAGKSLPFDIRHTRRPIAFELPDDADSETRALVKVELVNTLKRALRLALDAVAPSASPERLETGSRRSCFLEDSDPLATYLPFGDVRDKMEAVWVGGPRQLFLRLIPERTTTPKEHRELQGMVHDLPVLGPPSPRTRYDYDAANHHGAVGFHATEDDKVLHVRQMVQLTTGGEIWGVDARCLTHEAIPFLEPTLARVLAGYLCFASERLHLESPVTIECGLIGIGGMSVCRPDPPAGHFWPDGQVVGSMVSEECSWERTGVSLKPVGESRLWTSDSHPLSADSLVVHAYEVLMPMFDMFWDKTSAPRPDFLPRIED